MTVYKIRYIKIIFTYLLFLSFLSIKNSNIVKNIGVLWNCATVNSPNATKMDMTVSFLTMIGKQICIEKLIKKPLVKKYFDDLYYFATKFIGKEPKPKKNEKIMINNEAKNIREKCFLGHLTKAYSLKIIDSIVNLGLGSFSNSQFSIAFIELQNSALVFILPILSLYANYFINHYYLINYFPDPPDHQSFSVLNSILDKTAFEYIPQELSSMHLNNDNIIKNNLFWSRTFFCLRRPTIILLSNHVNALFLNVLKTTSFFKNNSLRTKRLFFAIQGFSSGCFNYLFDNTIKEKTIKEDKKYFFISPMGKFFKRLDKTQPEELKHPITLLRRLTGFFNKENTKIFSKNKHK